MRELKYYPEDFYTFEDKYRGIKRLNICGHSSYYKDGFMLCLWILIFLMNPFGTIME
ncbi:hypothetical protein [Xenorhabdus sp. Sc-CR9]|uniref:hypothetical protein n=1 Tax=Xenorhabdus sp. Sc-CR9 TaxID=2584468 RepID=UPI001F284CCA|nr:hypothetical protein [Xenorhabdus sp. Sc-CR9]